MKTYIKNENTSHEVTVRCAIHEWNRKVLTHGIAGFQAVRYFDACFGARCNLQCPERVLLGILNELWPKVARYSVVALVFAVAIFCICFKAFIMCKKRALLTRFQTYINLREVNVDNKRSSVSHSLIRYGPNIDLVRCEVFMLCK